MSPKFDSWHLTSKRIHIHIKRKLKKKYMPFTVTIYKHPASPSWLLLMLISGDKFTRKEIIGPKQVLDQRLNSGSLCSLSLLPLTPTKER